MEQIINSAIEQGINILWQLAAIVVFAIGAFVLTKLNKSKHFSNIAVAWKHVVEAATLTATELQQTMTEPFKENSENGKLTPEQISKIRAELQKKSLEKIAPAAVNLLKAVGIDICALIAGAGEAFVENNHLETPIEIQPVNYLSEPFTEDPVAPEG